MSETGKADADLAIELLGRAIEIGRELVRVCDTLNQEMAGNHISMGLDILSAHHDLAHQLGSCDGAGDQNMAVVGEANESPPTI